MSVYVSHPSALDAQALQHLAEALAATTPPEPLLVRLRVDDRQHLEVGLVPLHEIDPASEHPVEFLVGFEAPPEWSGVGIVAAGRATPTRAKRGPALDEPVEVTVCQLATRRGAVGSAIHQIGELLPRANTPLDGHGCAPVAGRIPDLLQRSLGLELPRTGVGPGQWIDQRWLDAMLSLAASATSPPTWRSLAALHPLFAEANRAPDDLTTAPDPCALRALGRQLEALGWDHLLAANPTAAAEAAGLPDPERTGWQLLEWLGGDPVGGWLLAQLPPITELLDALALLLPEDLMVRVRQSLVAS